MTNARGRIPLNSFGIAFGLSGLAGTWTEAARSIASPQFVSEVLWGVGLLAWIVTLVLYVSRVRHWADVVEDLQHPVLGPFAALIPIPPMLWGAHLLPSVPLLAVTLVWLCTAVSVVFGVWFISQLLTVSRGFGVVHSGYFLPTVAASLISGQCLAAIGQDGLAMGALGAGLLFWVLIGGAVLARLMAGPDFLPALLPTLGIFSAPPAVAGNAWWAISAGEGEMVNALLAGMMVAVVTPHAFLLRRYSEIPFALGFWAFTFTAAASGTFTLRLLSKAQGALPTVAGWIVLLVATAIIAYVAVRSVALLFAALRAARVGHSAEQRQGI